MIFPNFNHLVLQALALMLTAAVVPRLKVGGPVSAFVAVVALSYVNSTVWDAALFFQIPNSLSAHALTVLAANGAVFWTLVKVLPGLEIRGIFPALLAPVVFSISSVLIYRYGRDIDWLNVAQYIYDFVVGVRNRLISGQPSLGPLGPK